MSWSALSSSSASAASSASSASYALRAARRTRRASRGRSFALVSIAAGLALAWTMSAPAQQAAKGPRVVIAVIDGLRPDSISEAETPTLARLQREGVSYRRSHAAFPTVTRVNGATLVTGVHPARHGLVSNTMYVPAVDPRKPFSTGEWQQLLRLREASAGRVLLTRTLGEILQARGLAFAAVSSGSTGSGFVLNPRAPEGVGWFVSGGLDPGRRVAFPDRANEEIARRFGGVPKAEATASLEWTERVLRELVVPDLRPDLIVDWMTEPDGAQHEHGVGSAEGRAGIRNSDRHLGLLLEALERQGLGGRVDVIVTSDHGFARHGHAVNVTQALVRAGLKASPASDDVVVVSNGQSVLLHVKGRDGERIRKVVELLQAQPEVDVIFTRAARGASASGAARGTGPRGLPVEGGVPGTFSLELAHTAVATAASTDASNAAGAPTVAPTSATASASAGAGAPSGISGAAGGDLAARAADIVFTLRWSAAPNRYGVPGTQTVHSDTREGALEGEASGHGGLSPFAVRNTLILWGPSIVRGAQLDTPAGIVDITPTALALLGVDAGTDVTFDGRVLGEAIREGLPAKARAARDGAKDGHAWQETLRVAAGAYAATLRVSGVGDRWYVDEGARVRN